MKLGKGAWRKTPGKCSKCGKSYRIGNHADCGPVTVAKGHAKKRLNTRSVTHLAKIGG